MDSMEQSIWIPCTSPYGFHGTVHGFHMDSIVRVLILVILVEFEN